ncbi:MAG: hypothetical protein FJW26_11730 [Acidimicrobiia bacterium]|nr:hypothetical protein [Acidimicrobiia bacterium]
MRATAGDLEHAAYRLAQAVLDDVPTLDEAELRGLTVFIGLSKYRCEAMRERISLPSKNSGEQFFVPRSGTSPLDFTGERLVHVSGRDLQRDKRLSRWHEIELFVTNSNRYVVAIHFACETKHDDPYDEAEAFDSPTDVIEYLEEFDPVEGVRGWTLDRHREQDRRLRTALTNSFQRLVSQLLAGRPEFAQKL